MENRPHDNGRHRCGRSARRRDHQTVQMIPGAAEQAYLRAMPRHLLQPTLSQALTIGLRILRLQRSAAGAAAVADQLDALVQQAHNVGRRVSRQ